MGANGTLDPLILAGARSKGKRPYFLASQDTERMMNILLGVAQELAVMRARLDTVERLLDQKGVVTRADIEAFAPSKDQAAERGAWTQEYFARIFRILQQEKEALDADDQYSEDIADELSKT